MKQVNYPFILLAVLCMLMPSSILAVLPGTWPAMDLPPPTSDIYTNLVNLTKVSQAPVNPLNSTCPTVNTYCRWTCDNCIRSNDIVSCPNKLDWALTLDAGPSEYTSTVLNFLDTQNIKVTFFVVGSRVYQYPEILQRILKSGHEIGVLTWSNSWLTTQTNEQVIAELKWTMDAVKAAVNITPKFMRPPFGDYDDRIRDISTQLGLRPVIWDLDTYDWKSDGDSTFNFSWIVNNFTQWIADPNLNNTGHISIEYDLYNQTAAQVSLVVPILKNASYNIKPVSVCMGINHPYVEDVNLDGTPLPIPTNTSNTTLNAPNSATNTTNQSNSNSSNSSSSNHTPIIIGVVGSIAILSLFVIIALLVCKKRKKRRFNSVAVFGVNVEDRFQKF
ncbi:24249_t:CDS:2 [Cetraspora pellucida]|uniref:24249_t:CDS:1 n=1 Tax=Cetraspora pellucida TaxID=1433469 RepID=A0A9N9HKX5_9GLOM|nr:24249_t:CDS:2 [Cetraspora pellucida]